MKVESFTNVFWRNLDSKKRFLIHQGGSSSGKTYSIIQYLVLTAFKYKGSKEKVISIVSETLPHLKRGAIRDFLNIMRGFGMFNSANWNKSENIYRFNNSIIEFFSVDNEQRVRGPRRDILFVNECNNISYDTFNQLEIRTREKIILDYNPVSEFWVHEKIINAKQDHDFVHSTYKDNTFLDKSIVKAIESRRELDKNWWTIYGLGEIGKSEGLIFDSWHQVESIPKDAELLAYGLDFGYTNDQTALIGLWKFNNEVYLKEFIYSTGMTNPDIARELERLKIGKDSYIYADSSEPKSIEEIYSFGYNIMPVKKGADSILFGIDTLKQHKLNVTKDSLNLIKELRNYSWSKDKNGHQVNKPIDSWNHAIDALRYSAMMTLGKQQEESSPIIKFS